MPLLPSALPPKGEARRYVANDFLNLMALPERGMTHMTKYDFFTIVFFCEYVCYSTDQVTNRKTALLLTR